MLRGSQGTGGRGKAIAMPMKSKSASKNISEYHQGSSYRKMMAKYGKKHADRIAVAAGMSAARKNKGKKS